MSLFKEFKSFAMRGNVVDMAVGIIIGAAFGKIISSLVSDILMPPIGMLIGGMDFSNLGITIKEAAADHAAVVIKYGMFINILIDFLDCCLRNVYDYSGNESASKKTGNRNRNFNNKRMSRMPDGNPYQCKAMRILYDRSKIVSTIITKRGVL